MGEFFVTVFAPVGKIAICISAVVAVAIIARFAISVWRVVSTELYWRERGM